jgi:hypothetical protein
MERGRQGSRSEAKLMDFVFGGRCSIAPRMVDNLLTAAG